MKLAIMASGVGSNAQAIIDKIRQGVLDASIELVLSNRPDAQVLERAAKANLPSLVIERKNFSSRQEYDAALVSALQESGCEIVVLAGYMLLLSRVFLEAYGGRVLNIHPSLLPAFPGTEGAADALRHSVKLTGCSVHFVEEEMDMGPLIIQGAVPVKAGEDLEQLKQRIHALEHRVYPQALQWLADGRISVSGRNVFLAPGRKKQIIPDGEWFAWPPLEEGF